ncbi:hypothetical protein N7495_005139 [Penicillium taxi]|uniref:uncharacterized protein n=1 Tax=Penicillium taxi TaxID=168475 RepID=UPI002544E0BD|nr:uncharacterized protein N7495_005139 [Penicillium taxi]KAJ5893448.1 hypothetical protein N7495_005139 [Penicillium taxi]
MQFLSPGNATLNSEWNRRQYDEFEKDFFNARRHLPSSWISKSRSPKYQGFEWLENGTSGAEIRWPEVSDLAQRPEKAVRIVFTSLDIPHRNGGPKILDLYKHYSIPGAFVAERRQDVACSFGATHGVEGTTYTWFHFLCKNIPTANIDGVKKIINQNKQNESDPSQADYSWVRSAYCLKVTRPSKESKATSVDLITFGSRKELYERFKLVSQCMVYEEIIEDPHCLLNVVFDVLYEQIDRLTWEIADVFTPAEKKVLSTASRNSGLNTDDLDFPGMHWIQRHQIYLLEAIEAFTETLNAASSHYENVISSSSISTSSTLAGFQYTKMLLRSTDLRLQSLGKRTESIINLAFNVVTQADSQAMKGDSQVMKNIAILTMVFLPCTAVATFLSTPFFYLDDSKKLGVSPYFWIAWADF